jgi:AcrR family transcriptional regulator
MSQAPDDGGRRKPGRPRSEEAREKILAAAHAILIGEGLGRLTVEAVAARAHVGKPTIYRYWANAQELALAAFLSRPPQVREIAPSRSAKDDLADHLAGVIAAFASARGRQIALTMASVDGVSELSKAFRNQVILKSREAGRAILARARESGEIGAATAVETALDMIYGPIFYRLLAGHQPLSAAFAAELVETVFAGIGRKEG